MARGERTSTREGIGWLALLAALTLLGSFLLFLVQPIQGRFILPWFGGGAEVWATALLFFQATLLLGYGYSHLLSHIRSRRTQAAVHAALVLAAALVLPIVPDESLRPAGPEAPIARILLTLAATVGPPYLLLATTAPLLQRWAADLWPRRSPYPLYAISNVAAIAALAAYPVVVEPLWGLQSQARAWSLAYIAFALGVVALAWRIGRRAGGGEGGIEGAAESAMPAAGGPSAPDGRVTAGRLLLWTAGAAAGTTMLVSTTNALTDSIVSFPFLWVWPLAVYLLTFVLVFSSDRLYAPTPFLVVFIGACWYAAYLVATPAVPLRFTLALYLGVLFVMCMTVHGEVARSRPAPQRLTLFYVTVAAGGALGGGFVAIAAPLWFPARWEYAIGIVLSAVVLVAARSRAWRTAGAIPRWATRYPEALGGVGVVVLALGLATQIDAQRAGLVAEHRNFYGTIAVLDTSTAEGIPLRVVVHSGTNHGAQLLDEAREQPTTYYTAASGIGLVLSHHPARGPGFRAGVLGLGSGNLATHASEGEHWTFYEINPLMADVAEQHFTALEDARRRGAEVDVVLGDGRLALERALEASPEAFDLLVMDAFTGGAIPAHLLTLEAMEVYRGHLAPGGILAVHISNRYLDLAPVMLGAARELGMQAAVREYLPEGDSLDPDGRAPGEVDSRWVLLAGDLAVLGDDLARFDPIEGEPVLWTDDRQDLWSVLDLGW